MSFFKKLLGKNKTEIINTKQRVEKIQDLLASMKDVDLNAVESMVISYTYKKGKDEKGDILDIETKMVGDSFSLLHLNRNFQDCLLQVLAEEAQSKGVISNMEGITKH